MPVLFKSPTECNLKKKYCLSINVCKLDNSETYRTNSKIINDTNQHDQTTTQEQLNSLRGITQNMQSKTNLEKTFQIGPKRLGDRGRRKISS